MKTVLIIIGIISYLSVGSCIAAAEECDRYQNTGEYGLKPFIWFLWPIYLIMQFIKNKRNI